MHSSIELISRTQTQSADRCLKYSKQAASEVAARERRTTQKIAEQLFAEGWAGLRWWSAFFGEWHGTALFLDCLAEGSLTYGRPKALQRTSHAVEEAARLLGIKLGRNL